MKQLLPWQEATWTRLQTQADRKQLPSGLLITGSADTGKGMLVDRLVRYLLCAAETEKPCGQCSQCALLDAGTHPDYLHVTLEDSKKQILINQIRDMIEWATQTSFLGGYKACVLDPADKLNVQSSNALLKSLEETPANTLICLVTDSPASLLPTIRSRCQQYACHLPGREEALAWLGTQTLKGDPELMLNIAGGNPLHLVRSIDEEYLALRAQIGQHLAALAAGRLSPLRLASELKEDVFRVLDLSYGFVLDAVKYDQAGETSVTSADLVAEVKGFTEATSGQTRQGMLDRISWAKSSLLETPTTNAQMLLEWVFSYNE